MSSPITQEENQGITTDKRKDVDKIVEKPSGKFTKKHAIIALVVVLILAIGTGIGLLVVFIPKDNYVAVTIVNQRDDFQQKDEICVYQESEKVQNCTEVHINSTRVTVDQNNENTTNLIFLQNLKLRQYTTNDDGSKDYTELTEQNSQIEQTLKTRLRMLQTDECTNSTASECGNVNQVPLLTFVTDQQTGEIVKIGIPSEVDQSLVEPLISSIVHIGANTQNASESTNGTRRMLVSDFKNLYKIGKLNFLPKYSVAKSQAGDIVITKKITKSDNIGNEDQMNFLKQFDQQQDTILDVNSKLSKSRIQTSLIVDNSITQSDSSETSSIDQTQITSDSNLVTIETKSDVDLTSALNDIQKQQTVLYYSISDLQEKIKSNNEDNSDTSEATSSEATTESNVNETNSQEDATENSSQNGTRILQDENADMQTAEDYQYQYQETQGQCDAATFSQTRKLSEITVFKRKVSLIVELKGSVAQSQINYSFGTCIALEGNCVIQLQKINQNFNGQQVPNSLANTLRSSKVFDMGILILGYRLNFQASAEAIQSHTRSFSKLLNGANLLQNFNTQVNLNAYTQLSIIRIINLRAGANGGIFVGDIKANAQYYVDQASQKVVPAKYLVTLDVAKQASNVAVYSQYQKIQLSWIKICYKKGWIKICFPSLQISYSNWNDVFRKNLPGLSRVVNSQLFKLKSKCMS